PVEVKVGGFEDVDLRARFGEGDDGILETVGDEEALFAGDGRKFFEQFFRTTRVTADADEARKFVRVKQADFDGHQATLRKTEQRGLVGRKTFRALEFQEL